MARMENSVIARFEKSGERFEILVDPDLAMKVKKGEDVSLDDLLVIDKVFKDVRKGDEKGEERIKEIFNTTDLKQVVKKIITDGEIQLTTEQRKEMAAARRREVIQLIARNAFDPKTKTPHPPTRIENAILEAGVGIDANRSAQEQLAGIIKEIRKLIPISMDKWKIAAKIPAQYAGKSYSILKKYEMIKQEWGSDGSLTAVLEIPAGLKMELLNELNHLTHGDIKTKVLEE